MTEEKVDEKQLFSTRDLYLAATLVTLKLYLIGVDYQIEGDKGRPIGYFKFENTEELQEIRKKYTQGLLNVEPKSFITNIHSLKAEVTNIYKNPHLNVDNSTK